MIPYVVRATQYLNMTRYTAEEWAAWNEANGAKTPRGSKKKEAATAAPAAPAMKWVAKKASASATATRHPNAQDDIEQRRKGVPIS